ncbi:hypothetical protein QQF64_000039, partial [Cirrhinus molitorella]
CYFISNELKSWSDSRQYCKDHGADLVIINSEEKQRVISAITNERVWIGLSDREQEGNMTWVDNSLLSQGFWSLSAVMVMCCSNDKPAKNNDPRLTVSLCCDGDVLQYDEDQQKNTNEPETHCDQHQTSTSS